MVKQHCMYCGSSGISEYDAIYVTEEYPYTHRCGNCKFDLLREEVIEE